MRSAGLPSTERASTGLAIDAPLTNSLARRADGVGAASPSSGCPEGPTARGECSLPREGKGGGMGRFDASRKVCRGGPLNIAASAAPIANRHLPMNWETRLAWRSA